MNFFSNDPRDRLRQEIDDDYAAFFAGGFGGALLDSYDKETALRQLEEDEDDEDEGEDESTR